MNILASRIGPERWSHIECGAFYEVHGTNAEKEAIPRQIVVPLGRVRTPPVISFATEVCEAWVFLLVNGFDMLMDYHQSDYPLSTIHVGGTMIHDRHLEKVELRQGDVFHEAVGRRWREICRNETKKRMVVV